MELKPFWFQCRQNFLNARGRIYPLAILFLTLLLHLYSSAQAPSPRLNLSFRNAPIETVFKEIKKQSGYAFIYTTEQLRLARPVNIQLNNASLDQALEACFKGQPLSYVIEGSYIAVKENSPRPPVQDKGREIRGMVTGDDGHPLANVSVSLKGKNRVTVTNANGEFSLSDVEETDVLLLTSIGFHSKEIPIGKKDYIETSLAIRVSSLDETVVIAYGTTTKRMNTGTVNKVKGEDISRQPVSNPLAALQGRVPGLIITQANGLPGSRFDVQIRGQNSIQQGNDPLFVVDGVPFISEQLTQRSQIFTNNPFNTINPADIESIEVLKDADATAIYGSRAAGGVILITTKKARAGRMNVTASVYHGAGKITRKLKLLNTQQYLEMRREAFANDGATPQLSNAYDFLAWDSTRYTDLQDLLIGGTAHSTNAQVKLSGGTAFTKFGLGGNYYRESTVFPGNKWADRFSFNFTGSHRSQDDRLSIGLSTIYGLDQSRLLREDLTRLIMAPPTIPELVDSTGKLKWSENGFSFANPLARLLQDYEGTTEMLNASVNFSYRLFPGILFRTSAGFNRISLDEISLFPIASQNPDMATTGSVAKAINDVRNWIFEPQLEYNSARSNRLRVKLLAGASLQDKRRTSSIVDGSGFTDDRFLRLYSSAPVLQMTNAETQYKYRGVFGRATLSWMEKLILNLSARRDGSSRFGPGRQWANFGSAGAAYIFSDEPFFKRLGFLSYGKIRGSYGSVGNDQIGDYQFIDSWNPTAYPYLNMPSIEPTRIANPDYSWELTRKGEVAMELGFFKNALLLNVNWYHSRTRNQIVYYPLPTQTGFFNLLRNFPGVVGNSGWEFEVLSRNISGANFSWNTSFNLTIPKNELIAFPGLEATSYANSYVIGEPLSVKRGYRLLGIDSAGIYRFEDSNKDGSLNSEDYQVLGSYMPKLFGGIGNELRYKSWTLDFLFQFVSQKGFNPIYSSINPGGISNQPIYVLDRWQKPGDVAAFQRYSQKFGPASTAAFNLSNSDARLTDASFVRLKTLSLAWSLPDPWLRKINARDCRLYLRGQNLLTLTGYKAADPETQNLLSLPPLRMIVAGLELNF